MENSRILAVVMAFSLLGIATFAGATEDNDTETIKHLLRETRVLHKAGVSIHKEYDFNDLDQLKACVAKNGNLRDKAKKLRTQAVNLRKYGARVDMTLASDYAFTCVYCGGSGDDCAKIPPTLERVENNLASE